MTETDRLDRWSVRIAEWAAPGETTFAAQTTRAYAAGGAMRHNLFSSHDHAPGGMGGGTVSILPVVLDAVAYAADAIKSALGSSQLSNVLSVAGLLLGLQAQRSGAASHNAGTAPTSGETQQLEDGTLAADDADPDSTTRDPQPSAAPTVEIMRAALQMSGRLRARGIEPAEADELAARVTAQLLAQDDPAEVAAFLDALVGEEPPQPVVGDADPRRTGLRRFTAAASGLLSRVGRPRTTDHRPSSGPDATTAT
ncbi:hypothetical protein [Streptomyces sp. NPDC001530]|uniref:hypothetical protein n=1 Tax=Streptomyces sp. NPDC001530 TaxID=3364582 RepID=UPI0036B7216B